MPERIIDVHVHAMRAGDQGPPPQAFDLPVDELPVHDPADSYPDLFRRIHEESRGTRAVWSPMTDSELRDQTLRIMERRNIIGVVSGYSEDLVADWHAHAPERVVPGRVMSVGSQEQFTPDDIRRLHAAGQLSQGLSRSGVQTV